MQVSIPIEIFCRIAQASYGQDREPYYSHIDAIRIEVKSRELIIMATNARILCVERITTLPEGTPDVAFSVARPDALMQALEAEKYEANNNVMLMHMAEIGMTLLTTSKGYQWPGNVFVKTPDDFSAKWRGLFPDNLPTASKGAIYWNCETIAQLAKCAPSGNILFPEFIDNEKPVILNDPTDFNFVAIFHPRPSDKTHIMSVAKMRQWVK